MDVEQADKRFGVPGVLSFESGSGGLTRASITTEACSGQVYLYGAHVTGYQPAGQDQVLFVSDQALYRHGKAIRGGVPVCFPWFGPHTTDQAAPAHGPARITPWALAGVERSGEIITLKLSANFEPYSVDYRVTFGPNLDMALSIRNTSSSEATFEAALHTYLAVGDARRVEITGLAGVDYLDKVDDGIRKTQSDQPIMFTGETDRVYLDTESACVLTDPVLGRRIRIGKAGSRSTVVWNPWIDKAAVMGDFGDDEWPSMACIETANAGPDAVTLSPQAVHEMSATITVDDL